MWQTGKFQWQVTILVTKTSKVIGIEIEEDVINC